MKIEKQNEFKIIAGTFCIGKSTSENYKVLIDGEKKFRIPIFQRPYSWNETIITKFLNDIFNSYHTADGFVTKEPMFIGTMQVAKPKDNKYDIIDGQQRLTTLLLLLKVLSQFNNSLSFNWLETEVNNGEQQKSLFDALRIDFRMPIKQGENNLYVENLKIIESIIKEYTEIQNVEESDENIKFDVNDFCNHLLSNIYFVVIETHAGLSKTLQIFDTINTTGLDLNGGDIFKIRMYEYLTTKKNENEDVFKKISGLYEKIEANNKKLKTKITVSHILQLYQFHLIAKNNLNNSLYGLNSTTFFERLFDSIFGINEWPNFSQTLKLDLTLEEINAIIDSRFEWQQIKSSNLEELAAHHFYGWSRYNRYWILRVLFYHHFKDKKDIGFHLTNFTILLSKLFQIYSIRYQKSINEIHQFVIELNKAIVNNNLDKTFKLIENKISQKKEDNTFKYLLAYDLTANRKRKDIVCRIAALFYEDTNLNESDINSIINKIFLSNIDIEHIQAFNDENKQERIGIRKEWGNELNGLGNLVILERGINRSISNKNFVEKISGYKKSKIKIIKEIVDNHNNWNKSDAELRRKLLLEKIENYFFDIY